MDTTRDPAIDFYRAAALTAVVLGHWLLTVTFWRDGSLQAHNLLDVAPWTRWLTWPGQPVPLFFAVGGWAGARSWRRARATTSATGWVSARLGRLLAPVGTFAVAGLVLAAVLAALVPASDRTAARLLGMPLWFLAVYVPVTAGLPQLCRLVARRGWKVPRDLALLALLVDVARFVVHVPGVGWANFVFVWLTFAALGVAAEARPPRRAHASLVGAAALGALAATVAAGWFPVSMVGVGDRSNNTPPTVALLLLGTVQACVAVLAAPATRRMLARRGAVRRTSDRLGALGMHLYLWHLCATLVMVALQRAGVGNVEPLSPTWWALRPLWLTGLAVIAAPIVVVAARFDVRRATAAPFAPVGRTGQVAAATILATAGLATISLRGFGLGPVALLAVGAVQISGVLAQRRRAPAPPDAARVDVGGKPPWSQRPITRKVEP